MEKTADATVGHQRFLAKRDGDVLEPGEEAPLSPGAEAAGLEGMNGTRRPPSTCVMYTSPPRYSVASWDE
eukprot:scaffold744_cov111-Isochrysis_galbana.AAC.1